MKKLFKSFVLAASALMLLAGCSGLNGATVDAEGYSGMCTLTISVDGLETSDVPLERSMARTIVPDAFDADHATASGATIAKYMLYGVSESTGAELNGGNGFELGSTDAPDNGTTDSVNGAEQYSVEIPYGVWELTLKAEDSSGHELLRGLSLADLRTAKQDVRFTLTTEGVTTAGHVNIAGTYDDDGDVAVAYTAGLYDTVTGLEVKAADGTTSLIYNGTITAGTPAFAYDKSDVDLKPGRYSFQVRFYSDTAKTKQVGYYEEIVVVAPGRTTSDTAKECGKIINQTPASPENLRAYLVKNSEDAEGYIVKLTWEVPSDAYNIENFVIYLDKYATDAATATVSSTKILGITPPDSSVATDNHEVFLTSSFYAGGSVRAASREALIKLPFNAVYDVSIRAQNFVGESKVSATVDACARVVTADTGANAPSATSYTLYTTDPASAHIHRSVISYYLNNGSLTLAGESTARTGTYLKYYSIFDYATNADKLLSAALLSIDNTDPADTTKNRLFKGANPAKATPWIYMDGTAIAAAQSLTYLGNVQVKAVYDTSTLVSWTINDSYARTITSGLYYGTGTTNLANGNFTVDTADYKALTFKATVSGTYLNASGTAQPYKIDKIKYKMTGVSSVESNWETLATPAAEATCVMSADDFQAANITGTYEVTIYVHLSNEDGDLTYNMSFPVEIRYNN